MSPFVFLGNSAWLDYVDTELTERGARVELLDGFDDLLRWGREAGLLSEREAQQLEAAAPSQASREALMCEARALRTALRSAAERLAQGGGPGEALIKRVNELLRDQPHVLSLRRAGEVWRLEPKRGASGARILFARIAEDFARFLTSADLRFLRRCADEQCSLYFYDTSKNHKRRWCSMDYCGNRAKAAGHRAREARPSSTS
jgi:predicted RNA-binding Zn ribbon-like protein